MDIIFTLLKQLAASLSPTEFLIVLCVIMMSIWYSVKFIMRNFSKNHFSGLFGFGEDVTLELIQLKLEQMESHGHDSTAEILSALTEARTASVTQDELNRKHIVDLIVMKKDVEQLGASLTEKIEDIRQFFKNHDHNDRQVFDALRDAQQKLQEIVSKVASHIEKIDEHTRMSMVDFKGSHKDIGKSLSDLSRDIALVERSIQNQISNVNAVKLR